MTHFVLDNLVNKLVNMKLTTVFNNQPVFFRVTLGSENSWERAS
jgi:hypothetical protein